MIQFDYVKFFPNSNSFGVEKAIVKVSGQNCCGFKFRGLICLTHTPNCRPEASAAVEGPNVGEFGGFFQLADVENLWMP